MTSAESWEMQRWVPDSSLGLIYGCVCCAYIINLHPQDISVLVFIDQRQLVLKKCFEILPDNHYEIFEKTCCPQVNEILQVADFATGANTFPVYYFIAFL